MSTAPGAVAESENRVYRPADVLNAELMGHERTMHGIFDYLRENDPVSWV